MTAPVVIFAYNRPEHLKRVLTALARNPEASCSRVYLFCDGPRGGAADAGIRAVRQIARQASGFGRVDIIERETNFGLARSIVEGVRDICVAHGRAIVLEDDIVPTPFFLSYLNAALDRYADVERVISIGCHTFDSGVDLPDTFFLHVPDCWGWGVWRRSWKMFDADGPTLLRRVLDSGRIAAFDFDGAYPYTQMLKDTASGLNQSWAIRWYAYAFLTDSLVLYPGQAVTSNIGFDGSGTHGGSQFGLDIRLAQRPIVVGDVPLEENMMAREAWKKTLRVLGGQPPGAMQRVKSRLKRMILS